MKVFISVDMEGTSGLERLEEIFRGLPGFDRFRRLMAGDANAVVQGAIEGGADEIVVSDSHGYMCNINPDDLVPGVRLKRGQLRRRWCQMKGFESDFDAVLLVGFHAKAGNADAIRSPTTKRLAAAQRDVDYRSGGAFDMKRVVRVGPKPPRIESGTIRTIQHVCFRGTRRSADRNPSNVDVVVVRW